MFVGVTITQRDLDLIRKYGKPMCRFTGADHTQTVEGLFVHTPLQVMDVTNQKNPNAIKCKSPVWTGAESVKMDMSVNGDNFSGDFKFKFTDKLELYRAVPFAGPLFGNTHTRLIGTGFNTTGAREKWGPFATEKFKKSEVKTYTYESANWEHIVDGAEEISSYLHEAASLPHYDLPMVENYPYDSSYKSSFKIKNNSPTAGGSDFISQYGGPHYIDVGFNI